MSSFKRKGLSKQGAPLAGTRTSPASLSTIITSSGIPSLDDILGGGIPLSTTSLLLAPDYHSAYGELVQNYFIAQGIASGQRVCVIDDDAQELVKHCMWIPASLASLGNKADDEDDEKDEKGEEKIKIAWRYEQMKKFQTTVASSSSEEFAKPLDLTCRIPTEIMDECLRSRTLSFMPVSDAQSPAEIISRVRRILLADRRSNAIPAPLRICVPSLGSSQWGDITPTSLLYFLHTLRSLLRQNPIACASICLAPHLSSESWGGAGWTQKLGWTADGAITLAAFTANPALSATFPAHHGLLHIHSMPSPHTMIPPSDKFSSLRGISSSAVSTGGSGENNLAFKCMRRRLIFETLHLDLDGGAGERRTTPSANSVAMDAAAQEHVHDQNCTHEQPAAKAAMDISVETPQAPSELLTPSAEPLLVGVEAVKAKKPKKTVAFRSDRPDLYDF